MLASYESQDSSSSGARYQRVTTYSVIKLLLSVLGGTEGKGGGGGGGTAWEGVQNKMPGSSHHRWHAPACRPCVVCTVGLRAPAPQHTRTHMRSEAPRQHTHLVRASPKSQILRSQVALSSRFEGLRSRCSTAAEWMYLRPRRI